MAKIKTIDAIEVLSAKGLPTVEVTVVLNDGKIGTATCSSDENRSGNQSVSSAIGNIKNVLVSALLGKEAEHQPEIDKIMIDLDGTQNKSRIGASVMFVMSLAIAKAAAESSSLPLFMYLRQFVKKQGSPLKIPTPIFNFINSEKKDIADFSEYLIIPASSKSYLESIRIGEEINKSLSQVIKSKFTSSSDNDYGEGIALDLPTNKDAFSLIRQAIEATPLKLGFDVFFGLNSRASKFFRDGKYRIKDNSSGLSSKEMINYYIELNKEMHLLYLEDPLDQNDWENWTSLFEQISGTTVVAGGDLIATNLYRLQMAIDKKAINAIVVKPSQIGTVIESLTIAEAAKETNLNLVVSHRTNETNDDFIADFSVAADADYIKIGSLSRGENIAKYNRLLQIDNQLKIL